MLRAATCRHGGCCRVRLFFFFFVHRGGATLLRYHCVDDLNFIFIFILSCTSSCCSWCIASSAFFLRLYSFHEKFLFVNIFISLSSSIHRRYASSSPLAPFSASRGRTRHSLHGGSGGGVLAASSSSSLSLTSSSQLNLESRRHLSPWAWRTIIGGVLGLGYVAFHFFVRSVRAQKTWIRMRLFKPNHIPPSAGPYPPFDRPNEAAVLRNYLNHPPAGPCIFVGPDGSGKSHILEQAIENRKMVVYIDLQREPVINGEEILTHFINKINYILPPTKFIARIFLKDESKMVLSAEEINKAFSCFEQVLSDQKRMGWPNGIPVICINDFHFLGSSNDLNLRSKNIYEDKQILKFMDWCLFLTDNKLCHVVFVTSFSFCHLELDTHSSFRSRREVLKFGYASVSTVKHHFKKVNQLLMQHFKEPLTESEIKRLATFVGGQVKDLDTVITGLLRGYTPSQVIDYMISDSLQIVSDSLESCLRPVFSADGEEQALEKDDAFEKYLRLWRMIEIIAQNSVVSRSDLLRIIFQENVSELETYESSGLVAYVHKKPITMSLSPDTMDAEDTVSSLARLAPEFMVSAGTPRLNMAFQILRKDEKVLAQKRSLEIKLKKKKLEKEEKELNETKKQLLEERKELVNETQALLRYHQEFQSLFGDQEFVERKEALLAGTKDITIKLRNVVRDQEEVKAELKKLAEEVKLLKKRSEVDVVVPSDEATSSLSQ